MVLVEHLPFNLIWWGGGLATAISYAGRGWTGVDLFFAISGFVIGRGLLPVLRAVPAREAAVPVLRFWCRRAWRLLPSAWLWLLIPFAGFAFFNRSGAFHGLGADVTMALAAVLDLANFHVAQDYGRTDTGVAFPYWSLSLEEQFYVLLPFAILLLRWRLPVLLGLLLLTTLQTQTPLSMVMRPGALAAGVLLAVVETEWPEVWRAAAPVSLTRRPAVRVALLAAATALLLLLGSDRFSIVSIRLLPIALISGALVFLAGQDGGLLWPAGRARRVAEWVGARSYALYLVHIPVYAAAHEAWTRLPGGTRPPAGIAVAALVAAAWCACAVLAELNFRLVEEPLRRRGRRVAERIGGRGPVRAVA